VTTAAVMALVLGLVAGYYEGLAGLVIQTFTARFPRRRVSGRGRQATVTNPRVGDKPTAAPVTVRSLQGRAADRAGRLA